MVEKTHGGFWPSLYDPLARAGARLAEWLSPPSEASSNDGAYHIAVELPGVAEGDITLDVHDGVLTLRGEKKSEREEKGDTWYFSERQFGAFSRSFRLPNDADASGVSAVLKDGVLTSSVPKTKPDSAPRTRVKISAG